jgi:hypothetical protein
MRYILCYLLLALAACKTLQTNSKNGKNTTVVPKTDSSQTVVRVDTPAPAKPDTVAIVVLPPPRIDYDSVFVASLLRSPCYGLCPHYELRVYASGRVTYSGKANVDSIGFFEGRMDSMLVVQLVQKANEINYMNLSESYPKQGGGIADFPLCVTTLRQDKTRKTIYNRNDAPKSLLLYERFFDELWSKVKHWEKKE